MFAVKMADGTEKYLVQLVGPKSYRMGNLMAYRGQTLTVSKRTRDYLVRKTGGAWQDFDPTPPEPVQEILPPQFGEPGGPVIDLDDIDPKKNPALSMQHALQLAGVEVPTNTTGPVMTGDLIDPADLGQKPSGAIDVPDGSGDMTGADLKGAVTSGGKSAPATGVKIVQKPTPAPVKPGAVTVE
jgi:hypothetical protein